MESPWEPGAIFCQAADRHFTALARLVAQEQELEGHPWDFLNQQKDAVIEDIPEDLAGEFEKEFVFYASGEEISIAEGDLPLLEVEACDWAKPGTPVVLIGAGDYFEIADTRGTRSI